MPFRLYDSSLVWACFRQWPGLLETFDYKGRGTSNFRVFEGEDH